MVGMPELDKGRRARWPGADRTLSADP